MTKYLSLFCLFLISCLVVSNVQAMAATKEPIMADKIHIELKLLNGRNLSEFLKGVEAVSELQKYLLVKIINKSEMNAFFKLKVGSKNSSIREDFQFNLIPPNEVPVYYVFYIGAPASFAPESKEGGYDLNYEIQDLKFQY